MDLSPYILNGSLRRFTDVGSYPLYYGPAGGCVWCADCAYERPTEVTYVEVNWEDAHLECEECGRRIESAYAEGES